MVLLAVVAAVVAYGLGVAVIIVLFLHLVVAEVHLGAAIEDLAVSGQEVIARHVLILLVPLVPTIIVIEQVKVIMVIQEAAVLDTLEAALTDAIMVRGTINPTLAA